MESWKGSLGTRLWKAGREAWEQGYGKLEGKPGNKAMESWKGSLGTRLLFKLHLLLP